jgi:hypothetical protein
MMERGRLYGCSDFGIEKKTKVVDACLGVVGVVCRNVERMRGLLTPKEDERREVVY